MPATPSTSSRDRLLLAAAELFLAHGFGPVGLDRIIEAVGVTKTTFYKHFPSKDDLIIAVLARQHEIEMRSLVEDVERRAAGDPRGQILAMFDVFDEWFGEDTFRGCMFLNAATEFPGPTDPIHRAAIAHGEGLQEFVQERAIAAGVEPGAAATLAMQIVMLVSGAVISRQTAHVLHAARLAKPMAEALLDQAMPGNGGRR